MAGREQDATSIAASVSYSDFIQNFGASLITPALLERFERVTGKKPHRFLRRGLFFAHRDLDRFLDWFEAGRPIYLYTGRGPSSDALHLGHMIPFHFSKYLQDAFRCHLVIQITDDEKYLRDRELSFDDVERYARSNIRDILAVGFDPARTYVFLNSHHSASRAVYKLSCRIARALTLSQLKATFGGDDSTNVGYFAFPPHQMMPCFSDSFPALDFSQPGGVDGADGTDGTAAASSAEGGGKAICLIPCGIEQDPYFRLSRDLAARFGYPKSTLILGRFIPGLQGAGSKMSASDPNNAVYMSDSAAQIKKKINRYAFSGGQATVEEHRRLGADVDVDVSVKYLEVFLEDDAELARIKADYGAGRMLTGEVKAVLVGLLQRLVADHQASRERVTDNVLRTFMHGFEF